MILSKQMSGHQQLLNFMCVNSDMHTKSPKGFVSPLVQHVQTTWDVPQTSIMYVLWRPLLSKSKGEMDLLRNNLSIWRKGQLFHWDWGVWKFPGHQQLLSVLLLKQCQLSLFCMIWFLGLSLSCPYSAEFSGSCSLYWKPDVIVLTCCFSKYVPQYRLQSR